MTERDKAKNDIYKMLKDNYPKNRIYRMPEPLDKKLKSFMLINEDLSFILQIVEQLISLKNLPETNVVTELALWQSIIVTYGKCFTENKAGMSKLDKSVFAGHDKKFNDMHDNLMEMRHSYIAHRGDTIHEQAMVFIKVSDSGYMMAPDTEDIIVSKKLASPRRSDLESYKELFHFLIAEVKIKTQKHADKAHQAFLDTYGPQEAKAFLVQ